MTNKTPCVAKNCRKSTTPGRGGYRIYERGGGGGHYILNAARGSA